MHHRYPPPLLLIHLHLTFNFRLHFYGWAQNADCIEAHTTHVDAFLYDDERVDELVENGQISRSFCTSCGSRETRPLSATRE